MKRSVICILLIMAMFLSACSNGHDPETCSLYYPYKQTGGQYDRVIGSEMKKIPSEDRDYKKILNEYLQGPFGTDLLNPFPAGAAVTAVDINIKSVTISLNAKFGLLKDIDLSIACACLAKTVFSIMPAQTVVLKAQNTFSDGSIYKAYSIESFLTDDNAKELGMSANTEE